MGKNAGRRKPVDVTPAAAKASTPAALPTALAADDLASNDVPVSNPYAALENLYAEDEQQLWQGQQQQQQQQQQQHQQQQHEQQQQPTKQQQQQLPRQQHCPQQQQQQQPSKPQELQQQNQATAALLAQLLSSAAQATPARRSLPQERQQATLLRKAVAQQTQPCCPGTCVLQATPAEGKLICPKLEIQRQVASEADVLDFAKQYTALSAVPGLQPAADRPVFFWRQQQAAGTAGASSMFCAYNLIVTDAAVLQKVIDPQVGRIQLPGEGQQSFSARLDGTPLRCFELLGVQGMPPEAIMRQLREQQFRVLSAARTTAGDTQFWDKVRVVVVARGPPPAIVHLKALGYVLSLQCREVSDYAPAPSTEGLLQQFRHSLQLHSSQGAWAPAQPQAPVQAPEQQQEQEQEQQPTSSGQQQHSASGLTTAATPQELDQRRQQRARARQEQEALLGAASPGRHKHSESAPVADRPSDDAGASAALHQQQQQQHLEELSRPRSVRLLVVGDGQLQQEQPDSALPALPSTPMPLQRQQQRLPQPQQQPPSESIDADMTDLASLDPGQACLPSGPLPIGYPCPPTAGVEIPLRPNG
jgi:hypothetical protein